MKKTFYILVVLLLIGAQSAMAQLLPYPIDTINGTAVYRYPVEKSIGLYRISVNFSVTQEEIIKWNPQLENRGLRFDDVIIIPVKQKAAEAPKPLPQNAPVTVEKKEIAKPTPKQIVESAFAENINEPIIGSLVVAEKPSDKDSVAVETAEKEQGTAEKEQGTATINYPTIRLAYLLPLYANALQRDKTMDRFYDFYAGSLIAVYEHQQRGLNIDVHVYDVEKSCNDMQSLQLKAGVDSADWIIGPAYGNQVNSMVQWAKQSQKHLLVPFINSVPMMDYAPTVWQFNPTEEDEAKVLADTLKQWHKPVQCVFIQSADADIPQSIRKIQDAIRKAEIPVVYTTIHDILVDSAQNVLNPEMENVFIFNTTRYNLQALMPHLKNMSNSYSVTLLSQYSWQKENITIPQIYLSAFHSTPDVSEEYQALFDRYFNHKLASNTPRYDLLGYDLTNFILQSWQSETILQNYSGTQSTMYFEQKNPLAGHHNTHIQVICK